MGMGKNLIIFCFLFSFVLWLFSGGAKGTLATELLACMGDPGNKINMSYNDTPATTQACSVTLPLGVIIPGMGNVPVTLYTLLLYTLAFLVGTATISAVIGKFPDPWTYFAAISVFLLAFVTFPTAIINESGDWMPVPIRLLIGGLFIIAYLLSFFEFQKGGSL